MLRAPAWHEPEGIEFDVAPLSDTADEPAPDEPPPVPVAVQQPEAPKPAAEFKAKPEPRAERAKAAPEPEPVPTKPAELIAVPQPAAPPPPPPSSQLAVTQRSDDPEDPPPDNARFIAEQNRRVLEESVARVRNMERDDATPMPSADSTPTDKQAELGNSDESRAADLRDARGAEERPPEPPKPPHDATPPSPGKAAEAGAQAVAAAGAPAAPSVAVAPTRASGAPQSGGEQTIVVDDGIGTFVIRKAPVGTGPLAGGSNQKPGERSADRSDRGAARAQAAAGPSLRLSWSQFEDAIGAEELLAQREAYVAQRKSQSQGQSRQRSWKKFRAAIENFVPNVSPGNQTALNTAASPFAAYLAEVHRRIHREFAYGFLESLPIAGGPFGDRDLYTVLEIVINGDGTVHQVGVAKTSGFLPFDYGAFNAVMNASPYTAPPRQILSGDGRVYVRWGFYRNERQCGTFNAEPYILPNPKGTPSPGEGPLRDPGNDERAPAVIDPSDGELGRSAPRFTAPPTLSPAQHG